MSLARRILRALTDDTASIVGSQLVATRSSRPRSNIACRREQADGLEASLVVWPHRTADDKEEDVCRCADSESSLCTDHGRADVERVTWLRRDPGLVKRDELLDECSQVLAGEGLSWLQFAQRSV